MSGRAFFPSFGTSLKWVAGTMVIGIAQVGLMSLVYRGPVPRTDAGTEPCSIRVLTSAKAVVATLALHEDPARLAVPDRLASSGKAWMRPRPLEHELREEPVQGHFLGLPRAPEARFELQAPHVSLGPSSIGQSTPLLTPPPLEAENLRRQARPEIELQGSLRLRRVRFAPAVQGLAVTNLVSPSRIHLTVERSGRVQSARIVGNSATLSTEQARADQAALAAARAMVFEAEPDAGAELSFGEARVRWTLAPSLVNP